MTNTTANPSLTLAASSDRSVLPIHVVALMNFIPPHMRPVIVELARRVTKLTTLVSTVMESNREWRTDWSDLDVREQRCLSVLRRWRHPLVQSDERELHIPWDTTAQLRHLRPDVVLTSELGPRSLLAAWHTAGKGKPALVLDTCLSEHTEVGYGRFRQLIRKWLLRQADSVTTNGSSGERYLCNMGVDPSRIHQVPYTPAPSALYWGPAQRPPENAHRLLYVGRISELKWIVPFTQRLIRWAAQRPELQVELAVAGSGPLEQEIHGLQPPANLSLRLLGHCSFEEMTGHYAASGILAFPTLSDEWGLVVNEAMHAGLPVLGSCYSQAVEDLCVDGETGWKFRPDVKGELENALDRAFATSAEQLDTMREAARRRVANLTPQFAAEQLLIAVTDALDRKRARTR